MRRWLLGAGAVVALGLTGCGTSSAQHGGTLGRSIASASGGAPSSRGSTATSSTPLTATSPSETIRLPPPPSAKAARSRAILAVARRFTRAYLLYQIGHDPPAVKHALAQTCTSPVAGELLSQPARVPSTLAGDPAEHPAAISALVYTGQAPIGHGHSAQIVLARYHAETDPSVGGQLTIELVAVGSGWRVAGLQ